MPKNVQTTAQLHSSHPLAKLCSNFLIRSQLSSSAPLPHRVAKFSCPYRVKLGLAHAAPHPAPRAHTEQTWCRRGPGRRGWGGSRWEPGRQQGARPSGSGVQGEGSCCSGRIWVTLQEELGTVTHQREGESPPGRETTPASGAAKSRMLRPSLWPPGDRRGLFCTFLEGLF